MSRAQHTPGPWTVDEVLGEVRSGLRTVAVIMAQDDYEKPDLQLIAAAPDLLAALTAMLPQFEQLYEARVGGLSGEAMVARAAIAEATGK